MPKRVQFIFIQFATIILLGGCHAAIPEKGSDAITLMAKYNQRGRHDDAIRVAQEWLKRHPEDPLHGAMFYEQMGITYLMKASKDSGRKHEWIRQAVIYYDKDLSVHQKKDVDLELYSAGRGFEAAGDLSTRDGCLYCGRAVRTFEQAASFIQGDSFTAYGKTISLAPVRKENEQALERVKVKFAKANCK